MAGADDDNAAWAAQFAEELTKQAAAVLDQFGLIAVEAGDNWADDEAAWLRSAQRIEALLSHFLQDHSEAFVAAWPEFVRKVTGLLPLLNRSQPMFVVLAQLVPLLAGPEVLRRVIETRGESLAEWLEQLLADLAR